ncbi:PLP-dependent transferase [Ramicandelaber brevisporus]|nr:PLP-dependent transferase [Ramicandelaber brevisporus]
MRSYGASGLRKHIRLHTGLAAELSKAVAADGRFVVHAPVHFGLVTFRLKPELVAASAKLQAAGITSANAATKALVDRANTTGIFIGNAMVSPDTQIIRFSIGSRTVTKEHVDAAWAKIKAVADDLLA